MSVAYTRCTSYLIPRAAWLATSDRMSSLKSLMGRLGILARDTTTAYHLSPDRIPSHSLTLTQSLSFHHLLKAKYAPPAITAVAHKPVPTVNAVDRVDRLGARSLDGDLDSDKSLVGASEDLGGREVLGRDRSEGGLDPDGSLVGANDGFDGSEESSREDAAERKPVDPGRESV